MNEVLIDQIPNLADMLRALEELSLVAVGNQFQTTSLIVQQMPEIRNEICKDKNWKEIAENQKKNYFQEDEKSLKEDFERMTSLYDYNVLEGLIEGFKCSKCKKEALKRCSKCKSEYYCSRECQVTHWKDHKPACMAKVAQMEKNMQEKENKNSGSAVDIEKKTPFITEIKSEQKNTKTSREGDLPSQSKVSTKAQENPLNELD